ncbi:MAG: GNAT family N-acetyltransferase [Saprospiraceae bacterium]|nr:GNAT family N-acetyltransferase [Saprospiraceae bacterium]
MNIDQLTIDHLDDLVILFEAYRVWYRQPADSIKARAFLSERINRNESIIFGAFDELGQMVGFTQLYPLFSSTRMGRIWSLNDLFVQPQSRGQGISLQLLDRAKKLAIDTTAIGILLETEKSNVIGNRLYPRAGFHLEEDTHYYFWMSEDKS